MPNGYKPEPSKRVYKDCNAGCGRKTWAKSGTCSRCSRRRQYYNINPRPEGAKSATSVKIPKVITYGPCDICNDPSTYKGPYGAKYCAQHEPMEI